MNSWTAAEPAPPGVDPALPNFARVSDFLLGGRDYYAADRALAEKLLRLVPQAEQVARHNRQFLQRTVGFLAGEAGIDQLIDVGAGLPTADNTHQIAQRHNPDANVVYVDTNAPVPSHGRAWLAENDRTAIVAADMRDPAAVIPSDGVASLINFAWPAALLFASVLPFVSGDQAAQIIGTWWQALKPGSYLVISHAAAGPDLDAAATLYQQQMHVGTPRTLDQITRLFDGWQLVSPGLVPLPLWRPGAAQLAGLTEDAESLSMLGGVALRSILRPPGAPSPGASRADGSWA